MVRSRYDARHVRKNGSIVVSIAALALPFKQTVLGSFEATDRSIFLDSRVIHVQPDPLAEQRRAEAELELPAFPEQE